MKHNLVYRSLSASSAGARGKSLNAVVAGVVGWLLIIVLIARPGLAEEAAVTIWHDPPPCAVVDHPIPLSAKITAQTELQEARVYFKKWGTSDYYFVPLEHTNEATYTTVLPAPMETVTAVQYHIVAATQDGTSYRSPVLSVKVKSAAECPDAPRTEHPPEIVVCAEDQIKAEQGFHGATVRWELAQYAGGRLFADATEITLLPAEQDQAADSKPEREETVTSPAEEEQDKKAEVPQQAGISKKRMLGIGAGVAALAGGGAALFGTGGGGSDSGPDWSIPVDGASEDVAAELVKTPQVQTLCGTLVTNQLYVTNNSAATVTIGTIDYEVILTHEDPAGSCEGGHIGAFAPNSAASVNPGQTALVRQWTKEVNPCSGCPYPVAECTWNSRFIVYTSAGPALAEALFRVEGDLCGGAGSKLCPGRTQLQSDAPQ
jgi:hypothetical protein